MYVLYLTSSKLKPQTKKRPEVVFFDVNGKKKNLQTFAPCYSQSPPLTDLLHPPTHGFLGLEISTATAERG
jgi:hypothetical protein